MPAPTPRRRNRGPSPLSKTSQAHLLRLLHQRALAGDSTAAGELLRLGLFRNTAKD